MVPFSRVPQTLLGVGNKFDIVARACEPGEERTSSAMVPAAGEAKRVSALLPAYNEAAGLCRVLDVVHRVDRIDELVIVDDGSRDGTGDLAEDWARDVSCAEVLHHERNEGKGSAIATALAAARGEVILMLDTDLRELTPRHVEALLDPVLNGEADMTIGLFRSGRWNTDFAHRVTPWLSGQRCLHRRLFGQINPAAAEGYGLETALTVAAGQYDWRVATVPLDGVHHPPSESHRGLFAGIFNRGRMYAQIARAWLLCRRAPASTSVASSPYA